ncbi:hypothetical protein KCP75_20565 [Salmonella enterica subsp. enterica]|nr:hypothetical protein KCP75_20565 [Salmonella enterica subsp. enterica]
MNSDTVGDRNCGERSRDDLRSRGGLVLFVERGCLADRRLASVFGRTADVDRDRSLMGISRSVV